MGKRDSQPYADIYHVVRKMLEKDKKDPDVYNYVNP